MRTPLPNFRVEIRNFVMCKTQEDLNALEEKMKIPAEGKYDWYFHGNPIPFGEGVVFVICYDKPYEEEKS
jgi:hypothetical protein